MHQTRDSLGDSQETQCIFSPVLTDVNEGHRGKDESGEQMYCDEQGTEKNKGKTIVRPGEGSAGAKPGSLHTKHPSNHLIALACPDPSTPS